MVHGNFIVLNYRGPVKVSQTSHDSDENQPTMEHWAMCSIMCIPLHHRHGAYRRLLYGSIELANCYLKGLNCKRVDVREHKTHIQGRREQGIR